MSARDNLTGRGKAAGLTGRSGAAGLTGGKPAGITGGSRAGLSGKRPTPAPDPLADVEYSGDLAKDAAAELTALEQGYRDRAKAEAGRFKDATDSEYWFAVCFTSRAEKEAFLAKHNLAQLGDKYLAGAEVDRLLR